jgi:hypothetical protein
MTISDPAGNTSTEATLPLTIDATPLTVAVSDMPVKPGDADSLTITFSDNIVDGEFTLDNITLTFAGTACPQLALTRVDAKTYTISNLLELVDDDGDFNLTITLDGLHKALSGLPGADCHLENLVLAYDNPATLGRPAGMHLPAFDSITPSTQAGHHGYASLQGRHCRVDAPPAPRMSTSPWSSPMAIAPCAALSGASAPISHRATAARRVLRTQEPAIRTHPGEWTLHGTRHEIPVPEDVTAWEWRNGNYVAHKHYYPDQPTGCSSPQKYNLYLSP